MESVDKCGRPLFSSGSGDRSAGLRGPKGEGFVLDNRGNYLVSHKRIKQLGDPEDDLDAVNKRWLEPRIVTLEKKLKTFDADKETVQRLSLYCWTSVECEKSLEKASTAMSALDELSRRIKTLEDRIQGTHKARRK